MQSYEEGMASKKKTQWSLILDRYYTLCNNPIWIIDALVELCQVLIFWIFVKKIDSKFNKQMSNDRLVYGYTDQNFSGLKRQRRNLHLIINYFMTIHVLLVGYFVTIFVWANYIYRTDRELEHHNHICNVVTGIHSIDAYLALFFYFLGL